MTTEGETEQKQCAGGGQVDGEEAANEFRRGKEGGHWYVGQMTVVIKIEKVKSTILNRTN